MPGYVIARIPVWMEPRFAPLFPQAKAYEATVDKSDCISAVIPDSVLQQYRNRYPEADDPLLEYMLTGLFFYSSLILHRGMMLHASAVELDGDAYLFSAPSGTGKSTHTSLWLKQFPGARILNDDKPAIRLEENGAFVYGTPWSGKSDLNLNHRVKLKGICFLEQGKENKMCALSPEDAIPLLLDETVRPSDREKMSKLLDTISDLLALSPVFKLQCNMDASAAEVAYKVMSKGESIDEN